MRNKALTSSIDVQQRKVSSLQKYMMTWLELESQQKELEELQIKINKEMNNSEKCNPS
jgi:hypothetical protein